MSNRSIRELMIRDLQNAASKLGRAPTRDEYHRGVAGQPKLGQYSESAIRRDFLGYPMFLAEAGLAPAALAKANTSAGFKLAQAKEEHDRLKAVIKDLEKDALSARMIRNLLDVVDTNKIGKDSDWIRGARKPKSDAGIPMLFLSDVHFDEVVNPDEIGGVNEYNHEIAVKRLQHTFTASISLLKNNLSPGKLEGAVVALGGDMFSGMIHEELSETNEQPINKSLFDLADIITVGIGQIADEFGKVFVPCVVGNHSRMHKKPRAKHRVLDNWEWTLYQLLVRSFKSDNRVSFMVPESADAQFSIYSLKICLTHGDQFRGGSGIAGLFSPLMLGLHRKQSRQSAVQRPFDLLMMGHWHTYLQTQKLLVNGSVKGYDEYAYVSNFGFERPQQALTVIRSDGECTFRLPVFCDGYEKREFKGPSLSW